MPSTEQTSQQKEIVRLEKKYWAAMKENDVERAVALTRFPCTVAGPQGAMQVSEEQYRRLMSVQEKGHFKGIQVKNAQVDLLNPSTALINYSTVVDGMKMTDVSMWVRDGKRWRCAFHSENPLLDS